MEEHEWIKVSDGPPTRRMKVPGGWLYQVAEQEWNAYGGARTVGWTSPCFVPEPQED